MKEYQVSYTQKTKALQKAVTVRKDKVDIQ